MRPPFHLPAMLLAALAPLGSLTLTACSPAPHGLDTGTTQAKVRLVDQGQPVPNQEVLLLDDHSSRLGSATTDANGVAIVTSSQPGAVWLATTARAGRGVVARVTLQSAGLTDLGERALAPLAEQPSALRLRGIGFEERLTELPGRLNFVSTPDGRFALLSQQLVGASPEAPNQVETRILLLDTETLELTQLDTRAESGPELHALDNRLLLWAWTYGTNSHLKVYDLQNHRQVLDQAVSAGDLIWSPAGGRVWGWVDGSKLALPLKSTLADGVDGLSVLQVDLDTLQASQANAIAALSVAGQPATSQKLTWVSANADRMATMLRVAPCADGSCTTELQTLVFDHGLNLLAHQAKPDVELGGALLSAEGSRLLSLELSAASWALVAEDLESNTRTVLQQSPLDCRGLYPVFQGTKRQGHAAAVVIGYDSCQTQNGSTWSDHTVVRALAEGDWAQGLAIQALPPSNACEERCVPLLSPDGKLRLVNSTLVGAGTPDLHIWRRDQDWSSVYANLGGVYGVFVAAVPNPDIPIFVAPIPGVVGAQLTRGTPDAPEPGHTWIPRSRFSAALGTDGRTALYMMEDPLGSGFQLFRYVLPEVTR